MRWSECYDVEAAAADGTPSLVLHVHVQPSAGRTAVVGRHGHAVKVRVAAPPVDDRANDAVGELLASVTGVKARAVELVSGGRSRAKRFRVRGVEADTLDDLLDGALERDRSRSDGPKARTRRR